MKQRLKLLALAVVLMAPGAAAHAQGFGGIDVTQTSPEALRTASRSQTGPEVIVAEQGFVLKTSPLPSNGQGLVFQNLSPSARWVIQIPFEFITEGASTALVRCVIFGADSDHTVIGASERSYWLNGAAAGTIMMPVSAEPDAQTWPAGRFVCRATVSGVRDGIEWVARDVTQPGAADTDVWVREDAESRWWTGPAFERPFRLLISGAPSQTAKPGEPEMGKIWRATPVTPKASQAASDWRPPVVPPLK